jgi:hypothetical protein
MQFFETQHRALAQEVCAVKCWTPESQWLNPHCDWFVTLPRMCCPSRMCTAHMPYRRPVCGSTGDHLWSTPSLPSITLGCGGGKVVGKCWTRCSECGSDTRASTGLDWATRCTATCSLESPGFSHGEGQHAQAAGAPGPGAGAKLAQLTRTRHGEARGERHPAGARDATAKRR